MKWSGNSWLTRKHSSLQIAAHVADKVVFIDQGRIAVEGKPREVFHDAGQPRLRQFLQNYFDRNAFWTQDAGEAGPA